MSELEIYLNHWHISKTDGTFVLNGKYADYVEGLKRVFAKEQIDTLDRATKAVAMLKVRPSSIDEWLETEAELYGDAVYLGEENYG